MADVKISALPALTSAALTDLFAVVQGGVTYKGTLTQVVAAIPDADGSTRGLVTTGSQTFAGTKTFAQIDVTGTARVQERLTVSQDNTVATEVVSVITTDTANCGMVIAPTGVGAIMADIPDGAATGGNARGDNAVDLQMVRNANTEVASGPYSVLIGGYNSKVSGNSSSVVATQSSNCIGNQSGIIGGLNHTINNKESFIGGGNVNTISSDASAIIGGLNNTTTGTYSTILGGRHGRTYLYSQIVRGNLQFSAPSDSQSSSILYRCSITGTGIQELFLDGSSARAILNIASPGPTNGRAWRAQVDVVAIVQTVGNGTVTLGDCFMGSYHVGIKRIGTATSLVGTVSVTNEVNDTSMAGAAVTITADDTNEALKIEFTPATLAGSTTVTRVVATAYLTEVGY